VKINYTHSDNFISIFANGRIFVVQKTDPRYQDISVALQSSDYDLAYKYVDPTVALNMKKLTIKDSLFFWEGKPLPRNFYKIFIYLVSKNRSLMPYLNFILDRLYSDFNMDSFINFLIDYKRNLMPYDNACSFFVTRVDHAIYSYPTLFKKIENDDLDNITESTYSEYLDNLFGNNTVSFLKKEEKPRLKNLTKLHQVIKSLEYTREDVLWAYNQLEPMIEKCNLYRIVGFFKTFEKFKNWVNKSNNIEIKELCDYLGIRELREFHDELFSQSNGFGDFLRLLVDAVSKAKFKEKMVYYKTPVNLKKFSYKIQKNKDVFVIKFPRSNFELYSWGIYFHNCAASYDFQISKGRAIVFVINVNGHDKIIGELRERTKDGFV
jgi:hypothetical protein